MSVKAEFCSNKHKNSSTAYQLICTMPPAFIVLYSNSQRQTAERNKTEDIKMSVLNHLQPQIIVFTTATEFHQYLDTAGAGY